MKIMVDRETLRKILWLEYGSQLHGICPEKTFLVEGDSNVDFTDRRFVVGIEDEHDADFPSEVLNE